MYVAKRSEDLERLITSPTTWKHWSFTLSTPFEINGNYALNYKWLDESSNVEVQTAQKGFQYPESWVLKKSCTFKEISSTWRVTQYDSIVTRLIERVNHLKQLIQPIYNIHLEKLRKT